MKIKKIVSVITALVLLCSLTVGAAAAEKHTENKYLTDTLTLAGSAFDSVEVIPVSVIEALAETDLGYKNEYSMLTSGSIYSKHVFSGIDLYKLLIHEGMDEDLPDSTPVRCISKDGYTIPFTLGDMRSQKYGRYSAQGGKLEESGLPVIAAFASDGDSLVGPTGTESVYKKFGEDEGYVQSSDNSGGPLRLVMGQVDPYEFNAPNCSKWFSAIVVGDPGDYVYTRETEASYDDTEPDRTGDWKHNGSQSDYRLIISGSEAKQEVELSLDDIESMDGTIREYYAASAGRYAFEGIALRQIIESYLADGIDRPSSITLKANDGFKKTIDVGFVFDGMDSFYQPGKHRDVLLAWAVDGSPLVPDEDSEGYDGTNAYGPLRLIVENTISLWVKNIDEIVLGEDNSETVRFNDLGSYPWAEKEIGELCKKGIVKGTGNNNFSPASNIKRGDFMLMLYRAYGFGSGKTHDSNFADVRSDSYYYDAIAAAKEIGIAKGDGSSFFPERSITRQEAMTLIYRTVINAGYDMSAYTADLGSFKDGASVADWASAPISALVGAGVINGSNGNINPLGNMTRAEMSVALYRALENVK